MERLEVVVAHVKASQFKIDDLSGTLQSLLGDASLAQHSLATEQPLGTACLVRTKHTTRFFLAWSEGAEERIGSQRNRKFKFFVIPVPFSTTDRIIGGTTDFNLQGH